MMEDVFNLTEDFEEFVEVFLDTVLAVVFLVLISLLLYLQGTKFYQYILSSSVRGFIQLMILAVILAIIFSLENAFILFGVLIIMIWFSARTAAGRLKTIPNIFRHQIIAQGISLYAIMITVVVLGIIPLEASFFIPIAGMVASNSMNISYLVLNQLINTLKDRRNKIEAALALGATPDQTFTLFSIVPDAIKLGLTPVTNNLRVLGIVTIPGLMTGLIIGGVSPLVAAVYQLIIFFLLIFGGVLTSILLIPRVKKEIIDATDEPLII